MRRSRSFYNLTHTVDSKDTMAAGGDGEHGKKLKSGIGATKMELDNLLGTSDSKDTMAVSAASHFGLESDGMELKSGSELDSGIGATKMVVNRLGASAASVSELVDYFEVGERVAVVKLAEFFGTHEPLNSYAHCVDLVAKFRRKGLGWKGYLDSRHFDKYGAHPGLGYGHDEVPVGCG